MKKQSQIGMLAFGVLIINTVVYLLGMLDLGPSILPLISEILLIIVVLWSAWEYVKKTNSALRLIYFIIAILIIVAFIFGRTNLI